MKGLSLPINVLVIVVVAVIVLLGVVALYFGGFSPFSAAIGVEGAKNDACGRLVRLRCVDPGSINITNFDANMDGNIVPGTESSFPSTCAGGNDNLARLCICYYNRTTNADCKRLCGCP
jgi:hypothetical protein